MAENVFEEPCSSWPYPRIRERYQKGGTLGIKGITYQLKWLMLFLHRGLQKKYKFRLATEMKAAEKFDDIVFEYVEGMKKMYRFLQVKHKEDKKNCITWESLFSDSDSDYALLKYFISYRKIKENPEFKMGTFKDFAICSNLKFEELIKEHKIFYQMKSSDDILTLDSSDAELFKISDDFPSKSKVHKLLKGASDSEMLAKRLAECVLNKEPIKDKKYPIVTKYSRALANDVIDLENKRFHRNFLIKESGDSSEILNMFRCKFIDELENQNRTKCEKMFHLNCEKDLLQQLTEVSLNIPVNFTDNGANLELPHDVVSDEEIKEFLELLVFAVNQPDEVKLGDLIKKEIGKEFSFLNSEDDYNKLFVKMLDWMKEKDGCYLTWEDAEDIFAEAKRELSVYFDVTEPVERFTGRQKELVELHLILQNSVKQAVVSPCITGLGGIGKSELVRKYIQLHSSDYDYNIIWIHSETRKSLEDSFFRLAKDKLRINTENSNGKSKELKSIVDDAYRSFSRKKCLFVFDNATQFRTTTEEGVDSFLPNVPKYATRPYVIVTSQNQEWRNEKFKILPLTNFSSCEANDFIQNALPYSKEIGRIELANLLGYFPLALQQAVAYIKEVDYTVKLVNPQHDFSIGEYLLAFSKKEKELLDFHFPDDSCDSYTKTTLTTWNMALDKITLNADYGEHALEVLDVIAYLAPDNIPSYIFLKLFENDERKLGEVLRIMKKYSMVGMENGFLRVHRLVQKVIKIRNQEDIHVKVVINKCISILSEEFPHNSWSSTDCRRRTDFLPHLESLLSVVKGYKDRRFIEKDLVINLYKCLADEYSYFGFLSKERDINEELIPLIQQHYGANHVRLASTLIDLAIIHRDYKDYKAENDLVERASTILNKKALYLFTQKSSSDVLLFVATCEKLSSVLFELDRKEEAIKYINWVLNLKKTNLGSEHYEYAHTLMALAGMRGKMGEVLEEKHILESILPILERHYGSEHFMVANAIGQIGTAYFHLGDNHKAIDLLNRSKGILEADLGPNHFFLEPILRTLYNIYCSLRRFGEAKECLEQAERISQERYGVDNLELSKHFRE